MNFWNILYGFRILHFLQIFLQGRSQLIHVMGVISGVSKCNIESIFQTTSQERLSKTKNSLLQLGKTNLRATSKAWNVEKLNGDSKTSLLQYLIFSMAFNLDCELVKPELQLELLKWVLQDPDKIKFHKPEISLSEDNYYVYVFLHLWRGIFNNEAKIALETDWWTTI